MRKHQFKWEAEQKSACINLKQALLTAPVLTIPRMDEKSLVTTDASKYAVGATLEQRGHPVAYLSHRLSDVEMWWYTGDQVLLAFLISMQKGDVYLRGAVFTLKTDHEPIHTLQTKTKLSPRQQRWLDIFLQYEFDVQHIKRISSLKLEISSNRISEKLLSWHRTQMHSEGGSCKTFWIMKLRPTPKQNVCTKCYAVADEILVWTGSGEGRAYIPQHI